MKILITGGAGFIGSALVRYIIAEQADEVLTVDKLSYAVLPYSLATVASRQRHQFKKLDICNFDGLSLVFDEFQPDAVLHLAAETHVDRSLGGADAFMHPAYFALDDITVVKE